MTSITALMGNSQRLDGGAMFGNAPRALWQRWMAPDQDNRVGLACRALLIEDGGRRVLLEAGIGAFFEPRLRERYGVVEVEHVLLDSLAARGLGHEDIDVVVLSHLHFDHVGGLLAPWRPGGELELLFPKARFVVGAEAWGRARRPHPRDRASFIPGLCELLEGSGRLELVEGRRSSTLGDGYRFHMSSGHTPGLLMTEVGASGGGIVFASDLIPGTPWVHAPITMGYDRFPELLIDEKLALLADLVERGGRLFYTHDPAVALSGVARDERGRYRACDEQRELVDVAA
jgi:glyoxylase-like metal-dependent hydrolase (beta-lactamase superfamily II)